MNPFDIVSAADYQGASGGWGQISAAELEDLNKALTTSSGIVAAGEGGGDKLRLQSIENTLKLITFRNEHLVLWRNIPKMPAYSTTEEYTKVLRYGRAGDGFLAEVDTPQVFDQNYERAVAIVKFLGVQKETSLVATLVRNQVDDIEAHQVQIGTLELLQLVENALIYGSDDVNSLSWDGIPQQIRNHVAANSDDADIIIDCEGGPLTEERIEQAAQICATKYGRLTDLYLSYNALSDLTKQMFPKERVALPSPQDGWAGVPLKGMNASTGPIRFQPDVFIQKNRGLRPLETTEVVSGAPAAITSYTIAASNDSTSKLPFAQTYYYWVSVLNNGKESAAYGDDTGYATAASPTRQKITITVPTSQIGTNQGIRIYRGTSSDRTKAKWVADVPKATDNTVYTDRNQVRENTTIAFAIDNDPDQVWRFRQLAPLMKLPLAITKTSKPFMLLLFGVPIVYNPRRMILFENIGDAGL